VSPGVPFAAATSHRIDEIGPGWLRKDLAPEALLGEARTAKPAFVHDPRREPAVYRELLRPLAIGPHCVFLHERIRCRFDRVLVRGFARVSDDPHDLAVRASKYNAAYIGKRLERFVDRVATARGILQRQRTFAQSRQVQLVDGRRQVHQMVEVVFDAIVDVTNALPCKVVRATLSRPERKRG